MARVLVLLLSFWLLCHASAVDEELTCERDLEGRCAVESRSRASSMLQRRRTLQARGVVQEEALPTEEEKAEWLMMASFGPSRQSMQAMGSMSYAEWIDDQIAKEPTSHREYYRARVNSRAGIANMTAMPRSACGKGSRWINYGFSRKDEGLRVSVADGSITISEKFRTKATKGSEWASLSFSGYVCEVEESVGGDVLLKKGSDGCDTTCSSSSKCKTLPNPALLISPSRLFTETSLSFVAGPKDGVILLAAEAEACDLSTKPFIKYQDLFYLHDPRLALVSNLVDEPAEGDFLDPYYFMIDGRDQGMCRPEGLDVWCHSHRGCQDEARAECQAASEQLGVSYVGQVVLTDAPRGCLVDSKGSYYNAYHGYLANKKYQMICKRPCPVVAKSFLNEAGCRIASACGGSKSIVCGSPGEVASEPAKGHRFTSYILNDAGEDKWDAKRDPVYAKDWAYGLDKSVVWTMVALNAEDQLRQRAAWALSQIMVTSDVGFGYAKHNEMWLNFYDILVRHAFGSFRDLLKEITYNPVMADYLTYWGSKSFDVDGKYPDENYAREVMQLFTIGQWKLNMDGSLQSDARGEPILNYDNEDIMNFARVFTGFEMQADRGNKEREETARNYVDPMKIVADRRDVYPKPDLNDNYLGDGVPLCEDLPPLPFLQKGAQFEFLGFSYGGDALQLEPGSGLYEALQDAAISKVLPSTIECSGDLCDLESVKVIKAGSAYYEFLPPVCVDLYFFNARVVEQSGKRFGNAKYAKCANPAIAHASSTCCTTAAAMVEGPRAALAQANSSVAAEGSASHEYVTYSGAKARCEKQGMEICSSSAPSLAEEEIPVWTSKACHLSVAVDDLGRVAAQVDGAAKENSFMPAWENDEFPSPDDCPTECQGLRVPAASGNVVAPWTVVGDYVEHPKTTEESASQGHIEISMECSAPAFVAFEAFIFTSDKQSDSYVLEVAGESNNWHMKWNSRWFWSLTSPGFDVGTGTHSIIIRGNSDSGVRIKSLQLVRGSDSCVLKESTAAIRDSCVCPMSIERKAVFDSMPTGDDDILEQLFIGALKPGGSTTVQTSGDLKAYLTGGVFDMSTVFEYKGHFYKNMESVVHVGNSFSFRNAPVFMNPLYPTVQQAEAEVDAFLDHLVGHPNTPPFIAYRLIQRFTTSNPSGNYVQAVAEAFASGAYGGTVYSGIRGDLKAAIVATLLHGRQEASLAETATGSGGAEQAPPPQVSLRQLKKRSSANASTGCANTRRNPLETSREYSSTHRNQDLGTGFARSMLFSVACWIPKSNTLGEWMQINLVEATKVSGVVVQGRAGKNMWVEAYKVSTSEDGSSWTDLPDTFDGSTDSDTPVEALFSEPKLAKSVRITPQAWNKKMSMRAGLLVCDSNCAEWDVRLTNVQGSKGNPEIFFEGAFRPLCGNKGYWGKQESTYFCQSLGADYKAYRKTNEAFDVDAVEVRDWQKFHGSGFTDACTASKAVGTEIECSGELERTSTCPEPPTPAPTAVPEGVLQFQIKSAGGRYPGVAGFSEFYLNGKDLQGPAGNGFNVVTVSPAGELQSMSTWDTSSLNDMKFFVDFLSKLRHGTIILLSMKNQGTLFNPGTDATKKFIKRAVEEALDSLGATEASGLGTKMPYALIAKKGFPSDAHQTKGAANDDGLVKLEVELSEDAWPDAPTPTEGTGECSNWDVRLVDVIGTRGSPEVFISGNWRPLCYRWFEEESAVEFCKKLGAASGQLLRVYSTSEDDAVSVRTWGDLAGGGLIEDCEAGRASTMWIQCSGDELVKQSSCAPTEPQVCAYQPLASEACPCEHGHHASCDLPECSFGMVPGELCEADQPLPDGKQDYEVNNCAEHYDVFQYGCQATHVPAPAPTPSPQGGLHFLVKSAGYQSGFGGASEFYLNGASLDGTNDRGMNVVVLTATGTVVSRANFDLAVDTVNTAASLVQALADVEDGNIVLISVKDNAKAANAEEDVRASLKGLGAKKAFLSTRAPYVLIAKKGFPWLGIYEELGSERDYRVLNVEGWFPTTTPPTSAPTAPPGPAPPAAAPAPTPPLSAEERTALQRFGKLREPVLKLMHFFRAMEYEEADPDRDVVFEKLDSFLGQWVYKSPSVFNYYAPEYSPMSFNGDLVAPEFDIFTPPHAMGFLNGMVQALKLGLNSCDGGLGRPQFGCKEEQGRFAFQRDGSLEDVLKELDLLLTAGRLGKSADAQVVMDAYNEAEEGSKLEAAQQAILFTPEFNVLGNTMPKQEKRAVETADTPDNAAPKPYKAVVKLFLKGGMDSFNLLVPLDCHLLDEYSIARSDIALQPNTLHRISTSGQECSSFGIHPVMDVLKQLYDDGDAAFVANIGGLVEPLTKDEWHRGAGKRCMGLFSHSNQVMGAETLDCQSSSAFARGAGGRLGDGLAQQSAGSKYRTSSFSVAGSAPWSQGFKTKIEVLDDWHGSVRLREYESLKSVVGNITQVQHGQVYSEEYVSQLGDAVEDSEALGAILDTVTLSQDWDTESYLSRQLQQVAKMIKTRDFRKAERDLYFVTLAGFDHHKEVLEALQGKLGDVNNALKSFVAELKDMGAWEEVTLTSASDFGRTLTSNGAGSDHGWAGNHFIIGGSVRGGKIYNKFPESLLEGNSQDAGRGRLIPLYPWESMELPVAQWMGLDASQFEYVYPNYGNFNSSHFIRRSDLFVN